MKHLRIWISIVLLHGGVFGCAFRKDPVPRTPESSNAESEEVVEPLGATMEGVSASGFEFSPDLSLELTLQPQEKAQIYWVQLKWRQRASEGILRLHEFTDHGLHEIFDLSPGQDSIQRRFLKNGELYTYRLERVGGSGNSQWGPDARIIIPRDRVIQGVERENHIGPEIGRLFFQKNARLVTEGQGLSIDVTEIISDDGIIESHVEGQTASLGSDGRSSGAVHLRAQRARGRLRVIARGEQGGSGFPGGPGAAGKSGASGTDGLAGQLPPPGQSFFCMQPAGSGGRGEDGHPGENGKPGGNGGSADSIGVEIQEESSFQLHADFLPGKGGVGGEGGLGGVGGGGGPAGTVKIRIQNMGKLEEHAARRGQVTDCDGNPGENGKIGAMGARGLEGASGQVGQLCGYIGNNRMPCP